MKSKLNAIRQLIKHLIDSSVLEPDAAREAIRILNQLDHSISIKDAKQIQKNLEALARTIYQQLQ